MKKALFFMAACIWPIFLFGQTAWKQVSATATFTIKNGAKEIIGSIRSVNTFMVFSADMLPASSVRVVGDVSTLTTGNAKRDVTLQGEDNFNVAKYPTMEIISTTLNRSGEHYTGTFNVIIKGVAKPLEIPFEFIETGNSAEFKCHFTIRRRDFGVGKKGLANLFLSDKVQITVNVKAVI